MYDEDRNYKKLDNVEIGGKKVSKYFCEKAIVKKQVALAVV